jgi:hypothetical protein
MTEDQGKGKSYSVSIAEYFTYYPPVTEARIRLQGELDGAVLNLAEVISVSTQNEILRTQSLMLLHQLKALMEKAIMLDETYALDETYLGNN